MSATTTIAPPGLVPINDLITPEKARDLLSRMGHNRRLNPQMVHLLATMMREGRFRFNGDTVRITKSGRLIDGQHRLYAIIESGVTIPMLIVYGLEEDVMATIDQHRVRSVPDILSTRGVTISSVNSAVSTATILTALTEGMEDIRYDRGLLATYVEMNRDELGHWVAFAEGLSKEAPMAPLKTRGRMMRSMAVAPLAALGTHAQREGAHVLTFMDFLDGVGKGFGLDAETLQDLTPERVTTLQTMNKRLTRGFVLNRVSGGNNTIDLLSEYAVYIVAYNRYIENEPVLLARQFKERFRWLADLPKISKSSVE